MVEILLRTSLCIQASLFANPACSGEKKGDGMKFKIHFYIAKKVFEPLVEIGHIKETI